MNKVAILTDSTCDLSPELLKKYNVFTVSLYVNFGEESYRDGVDISTEKLYEIIKEKNYLPKTAAASPGDFILKYKEIFDLGYEEIFYTGISSFMSGTLTNANLAKTELDSDKIYLSDSKNLSTGIGLLILKACKYRDEGKSGKEIKELIDKTVPLVRSQFAVETMEYLHKGGRCSSIAKLIGTVLKIKPIIVVRDGKMSVGKKPRGKMRIALDYLIDDIISHTGNIDTDCVMITHAIANESCEYLKTELPKRLPDKIDNIYSTVAGCVISSHCGAGTIGILYILKEDK